MGSSSSAEVPANLRLYAWEGEVSEVRDLLQANAGNMKSIINQPDMVRS